MIIIPQVNYLLATDINLFFECRYVKFSPCGKFLLTGVTNRKLLDPAENISMFSDNTERGYSEKCWCEDALRALDTDPSRRQIMDEYLRERLQKYTQRVCPRYSNMQRRPSLTELFDFQSGERQNKVVPTERNMTYFLEMLSIENPNERDMQLISAFDPDGEIRQSFASIRRSGLSHLVPAFIRETAVAFEGRALSSQPSEGDHLSEPILISAANNFNCCVPIKQYSLPRKLQSLVDPFLIPTWSLKAYCDIANLEPIVVKTAIQTSEVFKLAYAKHPSISPREIKLYNCMMYSTVFEVRYSTNELMEIASSGLTPYINGDMNRCFKLSAPSNLAPVIQDELQESICHDLRIKHIFKIPTLNSANVAACVLRANAYLSFCNLWKNKAKGYEAMKISSIKGTTIYDKRDYLLNVNMAELKKMFPNLSSVEYRRESSDKTVGRATPMSEVGRRYVKEISDYSLEIIDIMKDSLTLTLSKNDKDGARYQPLRKESPDVDNVTEADNSYSEKNRFSSRCGNCSSLPSHPILNRKRFLESVDLSNRQKLHDLIQCIFNIDSPICLDYTQVLPYDVRNDIMNTRVAIQSNALVRSDEAMITSELNRYYVIEKHRMALTVERFRSEQDLNVHLTEHYGYYEDSITDLSYHLFFNDIEMAVKSSGYPAVYAKVIFETQKRLFNTLSFETFAKVMYDDPLSIFTWLGAIPNGFADWKCAEGALVCSSYPRFSALPSRLTFDMFLMLNELSSFNKRDTTLFHSGALSRYVFDPVIILDALNAFNAGVKAHLGLGFTDNQFFSLMDMLATSYRTNAFMLDLLYELEMNHAVLLDDIPFDSYPLVELTSTNFMAILQEIANYVCDLHCTNLVARHALELNVHQVVVPRPLVAYYLSNRVNADLSAKQKWSLFEVKTSGIQKGVNRSKWQEFDESFAEIRMYRSAQNLIDVMAENILVSKHSFERDLGRMLRKEQSCMSSDELNFTYNQPVPQICGQVCSHVARIRTCQADFLAIATSL